MIGVIGVLLSLATLVFLVFKKWGNIPAAIIAVMIAIITNFGITAETFDTLRYVFLGAPRALESGGFSSTTGLLGFVNSYFFLLTFGALFGHVLDQSGAAKSMAKALIKKLGSQNTILVTMIIASVLVYGGISAFVCMFAIYPICIHMYKEGDIPRRFLCGAYFAGLISVNALPGSSHIVNLIPTEYLGTTIFSAPMLGIWSFIGKFGFAYIYMMWSYKRGKARGKHFVINDKFDGPQLKAGTEDTAALPSAVLSFIAPVLTVSLALIFTRTIVEQNIINSNDAVALALLISSVYCMVVFNKNVQDVVGAIKTGIGKGFGPLFLTGAVVGYGSVIAVTPAYQSFMDWALNLNVSPYFSAIISVNVICGITGSASGGMRIFLESCGEHFSQLGVNPAAFHKVVSVAAGGLDSLPHNGTVVSTMEVMGSDFKESYFTLFMVSCIGPIFTAIVTAVLAMMFY